MDSAQICAAMTETRVFSHYAYGYPLPHNARYVSEDGAAEWDDAIPIYVQCQREAGHAGMHLAREVHGWED